MNAVVVIPARYASTRLPGKALLRATGKYLIQHVYEQARRATLVDAVIVATDDRRIFDAVRSFGGEAVMTRADHPSGTDRVAEAARGLDAEIILNVQGDEPEIEPAAIDRAVQLMGEQPDALIGTLASPFPPGADPRDPHAVKVVIDRRGRAMYFSRAMIPYPRESMSDVRCQMSDVGNPQGWLLHVGLYAYRRLVLQELSKLAPTPLEQVERLEQLRFLENGYSIAVAVIERAAVGIDTPADYEAFVQRMANRE